MTESDNIYLKYNVDVNRLTRDYLKFPLKKISRKNGGLQYEDLPKEDFVYLYIECNLPMRILTQYFNVSESYITNIGKLYNVKKSPTQWLKNAKKTNIKKFGVENPAQSSIVRKKMKQTNLEKFGVEYPAQSPIVREKMKQTNLEKFGVENASQSPIVQEKKKQTCLKHFGVENPFQSPIVQEKIKQTNLQIFGMESYSQTDEYKEKFKQTCLDHFGVENPSQSPIVQEKRKQTNLQIYGVEYYSQTDEFKELFNNKEFVNKFTQKQHETRKKNGSFGKSEEENEIYNILLTKFQEVIRQYKSDLYPYCCDFYIPEIDLYIEYQGYFTHGNEPYLGTDEQNKIVESWKNENTEHYLNAVKTWTIKDPLKRDTAKQNNLNWLEFFTMNEFMEWFEKI